MDYPLTYRIIGSLCKGIRIVKCRSNYWQQWESILYPAGKHDIWSLDNFYRPRGVFFVHYESVKVNIPHSMWLKALLSREEFFEKSLPPKKRGPINQKMLFINSVIDFSPTYQTVNWPTTVWCDLSCSWPVMIWILEISAVAIFSSLNCRVSCTRVLCVIFLIFRLSLVVS